MTTWDSLCLTKHNLSLICISVLVYFDCWRFSSHNRGLADPNVTVRYARFKSTETGRQA